MHYKKKDFMDVRGFGISPSTRQHFFELILNETKRIYPGNIDKAINVYYKITN